MKWKLIETALRVPGDEVLLYEKGHPFGPWMIGYVANDEWHVPDLQCGGTDIAHPTHWMPLPEAPQ